VDFILLCRVLIIASDGEKLFLARQELFDIQDKGKIIKLD